MKLVEPRAELEPVGGLELLPGEQHPRTDHLDALEGVGVEQPLHHLAVEQRERELLVVALHAEAAVEVVVLELDVVQAEMVTEPVQEVLVPELETRACGRNRRERTGEPVVLLGTVAATVTGLVVVPV